MSQRYIASCSFGKDSLAAIICRMEQGEPINGVVYCRIMFDDKISAEWPEHEEWIHSKAIPILESRYGIKTEIVQSERTYKDLFYKTFEKGSKVGRIYGFPLIGGSWCNSMLKMPPIKKWSSKQQGYTEIVGIAADENKRVERAKLKGQILPLLQYGVTEAEAFDICRNAELLSPAYRDGRERLGCWFCHNMRVAELRRIRKEYPALWRELMELDRNSPVTFKVDSTLKDFEERFSAEDMQLTLWDF